ncbi:MAG: DJ-1 family protein [Verrucomicrobia bacterium]|nr:DJ-1 family protein [Verrucomicrobiota bacterium]
MARVIVPLADGVEEMEAVIIIDVLRRAKWDVTVAAVSGLGVKGSRGVNLVADASWAQIDADSYDVLVIPGGAEGTRILAADRRILETVRKFVSGKKLVGAICAAPLVLQAAGVLDGRKATCHPGVRQSLTSAMIQPGRVVEDGMIVTSQGPGTTIEFALALIRIVDGRAAADLVAQAMVV